MVLERDYTNGGSSGVQAHASGSGTNTGSISVMNNGSGSGPNGAQAHAGGNVRVVGHVNLPALTLIREGTWCAVSPAENQRVDDEVSLRALATICLSLETTNYR